MITSPSLYSHARRGSRCFVVLDPTSETMSSEPLKLVFVDGQGQPRSLELSGRLCAGRAPTADIVVQGDGISREHCEFVHEGNEVLVRDLGSTNGTYVNGSRVKSARLKEGDTVILGKWGGTEIKLEGTEYLVLGEDDVLAIVD